jgi:hypothetical protein
MHFNDFFLTVRNRRKASTDRPHEIGVELLNGDVICALQRSLQQSTTLFRY